MIGLRCGILLLVLLPALALDCAWDPDVDPDQGLDPDADALYLGPPVEDSDPQSCMEACCARPGCDLALLGFPMDGGPQCQLVGCRTGAQDACVLGPSSQHKVYRKTRLRAVPLRDSVDPGSEESNNVRCRLPVKVGSCRAAFPRFYYNATDQSCGGFTFGGCEGNGNNFGSAQECETTCAGVTGSFLPEDSTPAPPPPPGQVKARMAPASGPYESEPADKETSSDEFAARCGAPRDSGPCRAMFQRWFFNGLTGKCEAFIYGGCRGNGNNHLSQESCAATCAATVQTSSSKKFPAADSSRFEDRCAAPPQSGPCRAAFPSYYFDPDSASCQPFLYGGCGGNLNRYGSAAECLSRCGAYGSFDGRGKTRNRWTAAFFLFVTLATISALLLVTLVLISVRRHRLSRRTSLSDKEELLPGPDDRSSVDSLALPESPAPKEA